jgi:hypothetical protein
MNATSLNWTILAGVLVIAFLAVVAWFVWQKQEQTKRLQRRFGPEYERALQQHGSRTKAESELRSREKRVERLTIIALTPSDAARFSQAWNALQARFIDNPKEPWSRRTGWFASSC